MPEKTPAKDHPALLRQALQALRLDTPYTTVEYLPDGSLLFHLLGHDTPLHWSPPATTPAARRRRTLRSEHQT